MTRRAGMCGDNSALFEASRKGGTAQHVAPYTWSDLKMARKDGEPETQHYVPKALLRGFVTEANGKQIYLYDKHVSKALNRPTSINNVGAERRSICIH